MKGLSFARIFALSTILILSASTAHGANISGKVTQNGNPLKDVLIYIEGVGTRTTDALGKYAFNKIPGGSYAITPSLKGKTFIPESAAVTVTDHGKAEQDFQASDAPPPPPETFNISGTVRKDGTGLSGVSVSAGDLGSAVSDADGYFSFQGAVKGVSYTISPALDGCDFTPYELNITVTGDVTGADFDASGEMCGITGHTLSGNVSAGGQPLSNVMISAGSAGTAYTDYQGTFIFTGIPDGSYTVIPSLSGYLFQPFSIDVVLEGSDMLSVNFEASPDRSCTTEDISDVLQVLSGNFSQLLSVEKNINSKLLIAAKKASKSAKKKALKAKARKILKSALASRAVLNSLLNDLKGEILNFSSVNLICTESSTGCVTFYNSSVIDQINSDLSKMYKEGAASSRSYSTLLSSKKGRAARAMKKLVKNSAGVFAAASKNADKLPSQSSSCS